MVLGGLNGWKFVLKKKRKQKHTQATQLHLHTYKQVHTLALSNLNAFYCIFLHILLPSSGIPTCRTTQEGFPTP